MPRLFHRREFIAGLAASTLRAAPPPLFEEIPPAKSGIHWTHDSASSRMRYLPETMGPGVAFVDYDNDGWMDIFLVNGGLCDFYQPAKKPRNGLYRNNRDGTFTDVTSSAGVAGGDSFGMGVAVGDYDNDGYPDLFVTAYGRCTLYRNNRNGTFTDVTAGSGHDKDLGYGHGIAIGDYDNDGYEDIFITAYNGNHLFHNEHGTGKFTDVTAQMGLDKTHSTGYATSAAFGDYDNDGRLDLYVCYYCPWTPTTDHACVDGQKRTEYCSPQIYPLDTHVLYHNEGSRFVDVSAKSGIDKVKGRGLAASPGGCGAAGPNRAGKGCRRAAVQGDRHEAFLFRRPGNRHACSRPRSCPAEPAVDPGRDAAERPGPLRDARRQP